MSEIRVKAYAKINFGLKVLPVCKSGINKGFHNIEGIFQTISLFDELIISETNSEPFCNVICDQMNLPSENTLTKAYGAFKQLFENKIKIPSVNVLLKKGIPSGGGLGGGSADAAALIRGLEQICKIHLSEEEKDFIAAKTGSDVFFFMHSDDDGKNCALVSGRGEVIKKIKGRTGLPLVLIFPESSSSTKEAYALLDDYFEKGNSVKCPDFSDLEFIYNKSLQKWTFKNSFTPVIMNSLSEVRNALKDMERAECCYSEMSGSGSTVFGMFTSRREADSICKVLAQKWNCKLVETV